MTADVRSSPAQVPLISAEAEGKTARPPFYVRWRGVILTLVTIVGAILRFAAPDRPVLWGDEALTYSRVIGTYGQMLEILRDDAFLPLHYTLYWLLGRVTELTPSMMRLIPAICGTAMIPAMYFAAGQIANVRVALAAAGLAACSAYLCGYSHDAKMYMQTWLMVALNLGCCWWWMRSGRWTAWLAWVATGLAAVSFHIAAALMLMVQPLFLLTQAHLHWRQGVGMVAGMILILSGPAGYYLGFNRWTQNTGGIVAGSADDAVSGGWGQSGIQWVEAHNRGATGLTLVRESAGAYLIGYAWPATQRSQRQPNASVHRAGVIAFWTAIGLCAVGALPWYGRRRPRWHATDPPAEAWWRSMLWIALALVIPVYGFYYCRSVDGFASPLDWWQNIRALVSEQAWWMIGIGAAALAGVWFAIGMTTLERARKAGMFLAVIALVLGLCCGIHALWHEAYARHWEAMQSVHGPWATPQTRPDLDWMSVWTPRYVGIVWPVVGLGACMLLMRLPTRPLRWMAIAGLLGVNAVGAIARQTVSTEAPLDRLFEDVVSVRDSGGRTRVVLTTLDPRRWGVDRWLSSSAYGVYGSAGKYYASIYLDLDVTPQAFRSGAMTGLYEPLLGSVVRPAQIGGIANDRNVDRLVVWERYVAAYVGPDEMPPEDRILEALGEEWELSREPEIFRLRDYHDWSNTGWTRRREFVRSD